ncbi:MAG: hypothetical protein JWM36_3272 [Hyphomicrobiales bacterium]|nr:hypothetical protein [Hyphomicrobiales bacterium]
MTIIRLQISAVVEFEFKAENYPAGFTPDQALALELEQASSDPHEYIAMPRTVTSVEGRLLREDGKRPLARLPQEEWGHYPARGH